MDTVNRLAAGTPSTSVPSTASVSTVAAKLLAVVGSVRCELRAWYAIHNQPEHCRTFGASEHYLQPDFLLAQRVSSCGWRDFKGAVNQWSGAANDDTASGAFERYDHDGATATLQRGDAVVPQRPTADQRENVARVTDGDRLLVCDCDSQRGYSDGCVRRRPNEGQCSLCHHHRR